MRPDGSCRIETRGGAGGPATLNIGIRSKVTVEADTDTNARALLVQSNGGRGGDGGDSEALTGSPGGGGLGGDGGTAQLTIDGGVQTNTTAAAGHAHGALVQSVGGGGADGGSATRAFYSKGGAGQNGGDAGEVTVKTGAVSRVRTDGPSSIGIIAQSIGGGGGSGGNAANCLTGSNIGNTNAKPCFTNRLITSIPEGISTTFILIKSVLFMLLLESAAKKPKSSKPLIGKSLKPSFV